MPVRKAPVLATELRQRLDSGEWSPGDLMPNERALASEYGVARNTVRKILAQMEEDGLIERKVGHGTVVLERPDTQFTDILDHYLDASPIDILNLRIFIEPHCAEAAARNASSSELAAIIEAADKCAGAPDLALYEHWDNQFHKRIYEAAHNAFLTDFFDLLSIIRYQAPMIELRRRSYSLERRLDYCREHDEIVAALRSWDGKKAASAMRDHLMSRRRNYFGQ